MRFEDADLGENQGWQMACAGGQLLLCLPAPKAQPPRSKRVVCLLLWGHRAWLGSVPTSPVLCVPAGGGEKKLEFCFSQGFLGWVHCADLLAASASPPAEGNQEAATASDWSLSRGMRRSGSFWRCKHRFFFPMGWLEKEDLVAWGGWEVSSTGKHASGCFCVK